MAYTVISYELHRADRFANRLVSQDRVVADHSGGRS